MKNSKKCFYRILIALAFLFVLSGGVYLFFFPIKRGYYAVCPLKFSKANLPYVDVVIEGASYPMIIDLGSRLEMTMDADLLRKLRRHRLGTEKWKNFRGTEFQHDTYVLPKIKMGSIVF